MVLNSSSALCEVAGGEAYDRGIARRDRDYKDAGSLDALPSPPIQAQIVGRANDRFYAQKGAESTCTSCLKRRS